MERIFGPCETMLATDTLQFNDYSNYHAPFLTPRPRPSGDGRFSPRNCKWLLIWARRGPPVEPAGEK